MTRNDLLKETGLEAVDKACALIAPTWPLDELVAVNPWWEMRDLPFTEVSARISALRRASCLPDRFYFKRLWQDVIRAEHLSRACEEKGREDRVEELVRFLTEDNERAHWHNISDLVDSGRDLERRMAWRMEIHHQISQFCADFFRVKEVSGSYDEAYSGLYAEWLATTRQDMGLEILMAEDGLTAQFDRLPQSADALIAEAIAAFGVEDSRALETYAHALLLDMNGWASWVAYLRWQDRLHEHDNGLMRQFLAIRMAWELVLWRHVQETNADLFADIKVHWFRQLNSIEALYRAHQRSQAKLWIWLRAAELAYQDRAIAILQAGSTQKSSERPLLQAAFCIDVRSEVIRRNLEQQDPRIQTLGMGGFFGMPVAYQPSKLNRLRPQLPVLLREQMVVRPQVPEERLDGVLLKKARKARWIEWTIAPPAMFTMVEAVGVQYLYKMIRNSFFPEKCANPIDQLPVEDAFELLHVDGRPLALDEKVSLAKGALEVMGLNDGVFAPTVMIVGHGSSSCNNPHASSLDCGACGGQTGEINARLVAWLLNQSDVREGLAAAGMPIPPDTRFIGALHNTTTDEFTFYGDVPDQVRGWFEGASDLTRRARALTLGYEQIQSSQSLRDTFVHRSRDWSQVRPEWGLAGNAAFIAAPRWRTRGLDLQGRAFLHDYDHEQDLERAVITNIMTAPMVVASWINLQYYASTCDNDFYGSGNKVLHNVVDGDVGVFEGNGGDLRIGLSMQSLHDGQRWIHEPLRLSVFIDAPQEAIAAVVAEHADVRHLIDNEWIYCFRWARTGEVERYYQGKWLPWQPLETASDVQQIVNA
ncbi:hypothetical protein SAMN05443662_0207 [Sulfurivirga caldicuralii]|uniref:Probable inorganic carbon transporter subunit DabA n=1 Tax=Sulfurivirga caldicuralii TaxID=364032 RepID=A0A1N6DK18_9GAMM|nr:DUF2309 domain-containing protein [Sulfurivirga caldicuralii]SIN71076.1 hypothetical protein SAMN05443662_0207 [Sulfurivirga caldicuralii]